MVAAAAAYLVSNTVANLESRKIASGFGFLAREAGFAIGETTFIVYSAADNYLRALGVGLANTFRVALLGVALATVVGTVIGLARLSSNWLVSRLATLYVEVLRNVPLLVQLFFWYAIISENLPGPRAALKPLPGVFLSNRGIAVPTLIGESAHAWVLAAFGLGLLLAWRLARWARRRQARTGQQFHAFWAGLAIALGLPLVVKTRRLGYDGKGQFVVRERADIEPAWDALGGAALIAEQWVTFDYEVSAIGVRSVAGEILTYPLSRNVHRGGILHTSCAPVEAPELERSAASFIEGLLTHLDYVGVLALELFVCGDRLLANEFAPRVHNSGHWTIEGARTSQFENHLRAILQLPLGPTTAVGHAGMVNLIGTIPDAARSLAKGQLHDYGKTPRPGRKLGHITVIADSAADRDRLVAEIEQTVT